MPAPEAGTVELRPDLGEYRELLRSREKFLIPLVLLAAIRALQSPLAAVLIVGALAAFVSISIAHIRTSRIVLSPTTVEHHGLIVRDRIIALDAARGVLGVMTQSMGPDVTTLVVQSRRSGRSLRVFGGLRNSQQLTSIAAHSGAEQVDEPMTATALDAYVPGSIPLRYRRPFTFALSIGIVVIAAAVALAFSLI